MRAAGLSATLLILVFLAANHPDVHARSPVLQLPTTGEQQRSSAPAKLPAPDKIVEAYLKAIGGKKRVAAIRDASFEWAILDKDSRIGSATTKIRAPASVRSEIAYPTGQEVAAANAASAWMRDRDGNLRTLTGDEAKSARLQSLLQASQLVDYKKLTVLARSLSVVDAESEPAYVVEFSMRNGARLRYWFSVSSKFLIRIEDDARQMITKFSDYRSQSTMAGILQPHRVSVSSRGASSLTFLLERTTYNQGLPVAAFDPPRGADALDIVKLLREVSGNQDELDIRFTEYAFLQKETDHEINNKGEVKKETTKVFEVFPIANRAPVKKLISENGVMLSGERLAKETRRVEEEFEKAERDKEKNQLRADKHRAEREQKKAKRSGEEVESDDDVTIALFLKVHDFVSPRIERFRGRDAVVFDFRVRPKFKPGNRKESLISKLVGVAWIDPVDKQVIRLEAKLAEEFKMAGGLLLNLRPGAGFMMEQMRVAEGLWLPRLSQINLSVKVFMISGGDFNKTLEWSDYKHFGSDVKDFKLDTPKPTIESSPNP